MRHGLVAVLFAGIAVGTLAVILRESDVEVSIDEVVLWMMPIVQSVLQWLKDLCT